MSLIADFSSQITQARMQWVMYSSIKKKKKKKRIVNQRYYIQQKKKKKPESFKNESK